MLEAVLAEARAHPASVFAMGLCFGVIVALVMLRIGR